MIEAAIPESELQEWFEEAARNRTLYGRIDNMAMLEAMVDQFKQSGRATERTTREGLINALRISWVLADAEHLSANMSIAPPGCSQMRPDLVLTSDSGHYVLVELKTKRSSERQGVQELLAYSAAVKMQAPYVNDFMYVIVANYWDDLLEHAVRALIMDGKYVLPLSFTKHGPKDFTLSIRLDLFNFKFVQHFDARYALMPATLGVYRETRRAYQVDWYLMRVASRALIDCQRLNQTGFVLRWSMADDIYGRELTYATLFTVNQHWQESEHLPSWYPRYSMEKPPGFHGYMQRLANKRRKAVYGRIPEVDFWAEAEANGAAAGIYMQSGLSYELMERHRLGDKERQLCQLSAVLGSFELTGEAQNFEEFIMPFEMEGMEMDISKFGAFGELRDYMRDACLQSPQNHIGLRQLIERFHQHKMAQVGARPDRLSPEEMASLAPTPKFPDMF